jgi:hypothetical protein
MSEEGPGVNDILQRLYSSEINVRLGWVWDGGVEWQLDEHNGYKASGQGPTVAEAIEGLANAAAERYLDSDFAEWWRAR